MPKFFMLCGLPCCGKSQFRQEFFSKDKYFVYSTDDYIEMKAVENRSTYSNSFKDYVDEAHSYNNRMVEQAIKNYKSVVWDQTNLTIKSRKSKLDRIPKNYRKICIFFEPFENDEDWFRFVENRQGKYIARGILENMRNALVVPSVNEGFDSVIFIRNWHDSRNI